MTANSTSGSSSIFKDGKLKPGVYKIQNLYHQNYLDVQEHSRQLWGYPARDLEEGRGLWEIKNFGAGYTVQRVEPGKPDQFCSLMESLDNATPLYVSTYPVAWRIEVVDDDKHVEYARIYWGTTKRVWDLSFSTGTRVQFWEDKGGSTQTWKLIPVKIEGTFAPSQSSSQTLGSGPPSYDEDATEQSSTRAQRVEPEHDEFGTIVNEVTVVTTTTRKRYRVEGA